MPEITDNYELIQNDINIEINDNNKLEKILLFKAGTATDGRKVSEKDITEIFDNTNKLIDNKQYPSLVIGHYQEGEEVYGYITKIYKENNEIYGDIEYIDSEIFEKINKKKFNSVSVEINSMDFHLDNNEKIGQSIIRVALLGSSIPAILKAKLNNFMNANDFYIKQISKFKYLENQEQNQTKEVSENMDKNAIETYTNEIDSLKKQLEVFKADAEKYREIEKYAVEHRKENLFSNLVKIGCYKQDEKETFSKMASNQESLDLAIEIVERFQNKKEITDKFTGEQVTQDMVNNTIYTSDLSDKIINKMVENGKFKTKEEVVNFYSTLKKENKI